MHLLNGSTFVHGGGKDVGSTIGHLGPVLPGEYNVSTILQFISALSPEDQDLLYRQLGVQHVDDLFRILGEAHPYITILVSNINIKY